MPPHIVGPPRCSSPRWQLSLEDGRFAHLPMFPGSLEDGRFAHLLMFPGPLEDGRFAHLPMFPGPMEDGRFAHLPMSPGPLEDGGRAGGVGRWAGIGTHCLGASGWASSVLAVAGQTGQQEI